MKLGKELGNVLETPGRRRETKIAGNAGGKGWQNALGNALANALGNGLGITQRSSEDALEGEERS